MRSTKAARYAIMECMETLEESYGYFSKYLAEVTGLSEKMTMYALRQLKREGLVYTMTAFRESDGLINGTVWAKKYKPANPSDGEGEDGQ